MKFAEMPTVRTSVFGITRYVRGKPKERSGAFAVRMGAAFARESLGYKPAEVLPCKPSAAKARLSCLKSHRAPQKTRINAALPHTSTHKLYPIAPLAARNRGQIPFYWDADPAKLRFGADKTLPRHFLSCKIPEIRPFAALGTGHNAFLLPSLLRRASLCDRIL